MFVVYAANRVMIKMKSCIAGTKKKEEKKMVNNKLKQPHTHIWEGCDDLVFVAGTNRGSAADVFCSATGCDMGAFTDEQGNVISHSIAEVGFRNSKGGKIK